MRRARNDSAFFDRLISFDKLRMNGRNEAQDEREE